MMSSPRSRPAMRQGAVLFVVLACCAVCISLMSNALTRTLTIRRAAREGLQRDQATLLLQAATRLACERYSVEQRSDEGNAESDPAKSSESIVIDLSAAYPALGSAKIEFLPRDVSDSGVLVSAVLTSKGKRPMVTRVSTELQFGGGEIEGADAAKVDVE